MRTRAAITVYIVVGTLVMAGMPIASQSQVGRSSTEVIEGTENGQINWTNGWVQAVGTGYGPNNAPAPMSRTLGERAGYAIALRNLLEAIKGVRVDAESFVKGRMEDDHIIRTKVSGLVQGAQMVQSNPKEDGGVEVRVKAPLWGIGSESLIKSLQQSAPTIPTTPAMPPADGTVLVDARGLGTTPALFPVIVNEQGTPLYNPTTVDPGVLQQSGPAKYYSLSKDIDLQSYFFPMTYIIRPVSQRDDLPWVGVSMPLSVRGLHAAGTLRSSLVISKEESAKLERDDRAMSALSHGKIIIIVDPIQH